VDVRPGGTTVNATMKTPAFSQAKPRIHFLTLDASSPQHPMLTFSGSDLGAFGDSYQVRFQIGGKDQKDAQGKVIPVGGRDAVADAHWVLSLDPAVAPKLQVEVPPTVALGTASITLVRTLAKKPGDTTPPDVRVSNAVTFPSSGGYAFATQGER